jgi:hypothetical protein
VYYFYGLCAVDKKVPWVLTEMSETTPSIRLALLRRCRLGLLPRKVIFSSKVPVTIDMSLLPLLLCPRHPEFVPESSVARWLPAHDLHRIHDIPLEINPTIIVEEFEDFDFVPLELESLFRQDGETLEPVTLGVKTDTLVKGSPSAAAAVKRELRVPRTVNGRSTIRETPPLCRKLALADAVEDNRVDRVCDEDIASLDGVDIRQVVIFISHRFCAIVEPTACSGTNQHEQGEDEEQDFSRCEDHGGEESRFGEGELLAGVL